MCWQPRQDVVWSPPSSRRGSPSGTALNDAGQRAARDEAGREEHARRDLALLLLRRGACRTASAACRRRRSGGRADRQVDADRPGERRDAAQLDRHGESPAPTRTKPQSRFCDMHALDDRRHQRAPAARGTWAVPIAWARPGGVGVRRVEQLDREADHDRRHEHADDEPDLLADRASRRRGSRSSGPGSSRRRWRPRCTRWRRRTAPPAGRRRRPCRTTRNTSARRRAASRSSCRDRVRRRADDADDARARPSRRGSRRRASGGHQELAAEASPGRSGSNARTPTSASEPSSTDAHRDVALGAQRARAPAPRLAASAHRARAARHDRRQRADQRDDAGHRHRAGADLADVGAVDSARGRSARASRRSAPG